MLGLAGHFTKGFQKSFLLRFEAGLRPAIEQFLVANDYVPRRWKKIGLRDFSDTGDRSKVVLIGDSFGQDIVNAVYETDLADSYFLSVYHIPAGCGNLFTEMDLTPFIKAKSHSRCAQHEYYRNDKLLKLIREADEIWLGSDWLEWTAKLIPQSLKTFTRHTNAKIRVFGRKNFGTQVSLKNYLYAQENDNKRFKGVLRESHISINKLMRSTLPKGVFIDISFLLCRSETTCVNTTDDGFVISYDGNHLTKVGAKLLGSSLKPILLPNI
jgi:hypothetical protein